MIYVRIAYNYCKIEVNFELWSCIQNKFVPVTALLDTGAAISHITPIVMKNLGYSVNDIISTVHGFDGKDVKVNNTVIDNFRMDGVELGPIAFHVSDLSATSNSIILGYNVLKEFNFSVNFEKNLLSLDPRPSFKEIKTIKNFSINSDQFGLYHIDVKKKSGKE